MPYPIIAPPAASGAVAAKITRPLRVVGFGDSNCSYALSWLRFTARLSGGALRIVNNAGVPGENSQQIVARFGRDVAPFAPDVVMIEFGTNDFGTGISTTAYYRTAIRLALAQPSTLAVIICATIPHYQNIAAGATLRDAQAAMVAADFANDPRVAFIDTYTPLLDPTTPQTIPNTFFLDVHFSRRGVHKFAETVLAAPAVSALLANIVRPAASSFSSAALQMWQNPNFDTGTETSGRAEGYTATFTTATFQTMTEAGVAGKFQRITIPAGHGFFDFKPATPTLSADRIGGRRIAQRYRLRIVQRPTDTPPTIAFNTMPTIVKDPNAYYHGDGQSSATSGVGIFISPQLVDLEDGKWYDICTETVCDEVPFTNSAIFNLNANNGSTAVIIDIAEADTWLIDPANVVEQGLNVSYQDASGSPGNATINKSSGRAAIASAGTSVTITSNKVLSTSVIMLSVEDADATATSLRVSSVANGSFVVTANAAATAATKFRFLVAS